MEEISDVYRADAHQLGSLLGARGINVINGAGSIGLMRVVSDAALAAGGTVTGVIPHFMVEQGVCHKGLTRLITCETMHERKQTMASLAEAVIALPGGYGTLEELLEIITWRQLKLVAYPVVILNTAGYYDRLIAMLNYAVDEHFVREPNRHIYTVAATPEEAVRAVG
jgi:uncharacterized protein (TIGR00730 family)